VQEQTLKPMSRKRKLELLRIACSAQKVSRIFFISLNGMDILNSQITVKQRSENKMIDKAFYNVLKKNNKLFENLAKR
jgi:hypothetical protein